MKWVVSMNLLAQSLMHVSSLPERYLPGVPIHFSQHFSVMVATVCCICSREWSYQLCPQKSKPYCSTLQGSIPLQMHLHTCCCACCMAMNSCSSLEISPSPAPDMIPGICNLLISLSEFPAGEFSSAMIGKPECCFTDQLLPFQVARRHACTIFKKMDNEQLSQFLALKVKRQPLPSHQKGSETLVV